MRHNNVAVIALSRTPNPTRLQKTLALNDWYLKGEDWEYPWGGIQMLGKSDGEQLRAMAPHFLSWGAKLTPGGMLEDIARHGVDFWMSSEDLPRADSRVTLDQDGTVHLSLPQDNNTEGLKRMRRKFDSMLADLGFHQKSHQRGVYLHEGMNVAATAHQAGTARFGPDPASSVLDVNCKAHELDNLYVVDSSFFVSIGAVNPTLTIIANALRVENTSWSGCLELGLWSHKERREQRERDGPQRTSKRCCNPESDTGTSARDHHRVRHRIVPRTQPGGLPGCRQHPAVTHRVRPLEESLRPSLPSSGNHGHRRHRWLCRRWPADSASSGCCSRGCMANTVAMGLLVASDPVRTDAIAYPMLLVATAALGLGFGLTLELASAPTPAPSCPIAGTSPSPH